MPRTMALLFIKEIAKKMHSFKHHEQVEHDDIGKEKNEAPGPVGVWEQSNRLELTTWTKHTPEHPAIRVGNRPPKHIPDVGGDFKGDISGAHHTPCKTPQNAKTDDSS